MYCFSPRLGQLVSIPFWIEAIQMKWIFRSWKITVKLYSAPFMVVCRLRSGRGSQIQSSSPGGRPSQQGYSRTFGSSSARRTGCAGPDRPQLLQKLISLTAKGWWQNLRLPPVDGRYVVPGACGPTLRDNSQIPLGPVFRHHKSEFRAAIVKQGKISASLQTGRAACTRAFAYTCCHSLIPIIT